VKIRGFGGTGIPGKIMLAGGFFAALVHIGAKGTGEREIRPEETQEGKGKIK